VLRSSEEDEVTIVGAGITVGEALAAAEALAAEGVPVRVVDCYSVKPIDEEGLREAAATGAIVVVEDHWPQGGLGEAVLSALAGLDERPAFAHLAVAGMPTSGKPVELLAAAGIDREHIADAARQLVRARALR
jgi:transketolase